MYTQEFLIKLHAAFGKDSMVTEAVEKGSGIAGRYLDDNTPNSINYREILNAGSLEELKVKARRIQLMNEVYDEFRSGKCYASEYTRRREAGCPRVYGQQTGDMETLRAFLCDSVCYIPDCPKYKTGECWKRFDELGLKMK